MQIDGVPADGTAAEDLSLYEHYQAWKSWDSLFTYTADQAGYFRGELRDVKVADADVLEIGFGSGSCLAWMRDRGARVFGTEYLEAACQAAVSDNVTILPPDLPSVASRHEGSFDTIVAFDIFEHLELAELRSYLGACETMLRPGGSLVLRFPNAQSPFGLQPQMGDPTHRSPLSRSALELLLPGMSFAVKRYGGSYRNVGKSLSPIWFKRKIRFALQDMISAALRFVYATSIPYDPVVVIVLRRT